MLSSNVLELSASLKSSCFVNYVKNRLTINKEDINNNRVIKLDVILEVKPKSAWQLAIALAISVILSQIVQSLPINVMPCSF